MDTGKVHEAQMVEKWDEVGNPSFDQNSYMAGNQRKIEKKTPLHNQSILSLQLQPVHKVHVPMIVMQKM